MGLYWQLFIGPPFLLSILLLPVTLCEYFIRIALVFFK